MEAERQAEEVQHDREIAPLAACETSAHVSRWSRDEDLRLFSSVKIIFERDCVGSFLKLK